MESKGGLFKVSGAIQCELLVFYYNCWFECGCFIEYSLAFLA
jgi:hypothetical protein